MHSGLPTMSLSDYLQKNYLSKPEKRKKEKKDNSKSKKQRINDDVIIEEGTSLTNHSTLIRNSNVIQEKREGEAPDSESTKKKQKKGWKVVGTDEVIAKPKEEELIPSMMMESGAKAGLQTAKQVAAQIRAKEEAELEYLRSQTKESMGIKMETIHRDSSGRKINIERLKQEKQYKRGLEEEAKERKRKEINMGLVQRLQQEQDRERLEKMGKSRLARYANDTELNERQRKRELDDDPMLSFNPSKSYKNVSLTGRKLYRGGFPENRFGITPGYRWDGVDRSNGFEKSWFKAQQEKQRQRTLSYTMQEDE